METLYLGNNLDLLRTFADDSIHCCVTSPPYWQLRQYLFDGAVVLSDPSLRAELERANIAPRETAEEHQLWCLSDIPEQFRHAFKPAPQIGLEPELNEYVAHLVDIFREVRRVLHPSGTLWLNLGDCYANHTSHGIKSKDLIGVPWMVAFALRQDGWYLRSSIIWHKPNCMPESVTDRPTIDYENIFLLTKSKQYFYDHIAIREKSVQPDRVRTDQIGGNKGTATHHSPGGIFEGAAERNKRAVWQINTRPYAGAHFAVFPPELPEICIKAGTSERGVCPHCKSPWERILEKSHVTPLDYVGKWSAADKQAASRRISANVRTQRLAGGEHDNPFPTSQTLGWKPTCTCPEHTPIPATVLDPFAGSGTTLAVAKDLRRSFVGIELNPSYQDLVYARLDPIRIRQEQQDIFALVMQND